MSNERQPPNQAAAHTSNQDIKKFVGVLTRGVGQRFVEGMDVPVLE